MSSWISRATSSHQTQLVITAVVSGTVCVSLVLGYQTLRRRERVEDLKKSIAADLNDDNTEELADFGAPPQHLDLRTEDERSAQLARRAQKGDYDSELITEQLARNRVFLTPEGQSKVQGAFIIVVGCGGVGSHVVSALARSGVSKLRVIDFDQVTLSSLNRHAVATLADVGTSKVTCLKKRLQQVAPWVEFDCQNHLYGESRAEELLRPLGGQSPDFIVDAIDNIDSKVSLLAYAHQHRLPIISSMGAGCKSDPSRVYIGDISLSTDDPLSRSTRRLLRLRGINSGIPVVYSSEKPGPGKAELLPLPDEEFEKGRVDELSILPSFRVRILPVLGTMPAVFGYTIANHIILRLSGYPYEYAAGKPRDKTIENALSGLLTSEQHLSKHLGLDVLGLKVPVSKDDVAYLLEEVFRGRSVISDLSTRLILIRWRPPRGKTIDYTVPGQKTARIGFADLACMTKEEAAVHEEQVLKAKKQPEDFYSQNICKLVARRIEEEKAFERYR